MSKRRTPKAVKFKKYQTQYHESWCQNLMADLKKSPKKPDNIPNNNVKK